MRGQLDAFDFEVAINAGACSLAHIQLLELVDSSPDLAPAGAPVETGRHADARGISTPSTLSS
jgi:hypothetical protein